MDKEQRFEKALVALSNGFKIRETSRKYGIPESSLRGRIHSKTRVIENLYESEVSDDDYFKGGWLENAASSDSREKNKDSISLNATVLLNDIFSDFKSFDEKCCLCFKAFSILQTRVKVTDDIAKMIDSLLQFQLNETNSEFMCSDCIYKLKHFHQFKSKIKEKQKCFEKFRSIKTVEGNENFSTPFNEPLIKIEEIKTEPEPEIVFSELLLKFDSSLDEMEVKEEIHKISSVEIAPTLNKIEKQTRKVSSKKLKKKEFLPGPEFFPCEVCGKIFQQGRRMREHHKRIHLKTKEHQCDICNKKYLSKYEVAAHVIMHISKEHRKQNYQCDICHKTYTHKNSIRIHVKNCRWSIKRKSERAQREKKKKHERPIACDICGVFCNSRKDFYKHERKHAAKTVPCDFPGCQKKFKFKNDVRLHKKFHYPERRIPCTYPDCEKKFYSRQDHKIHISVFHQNLRQVCPAGNGCNYAVGRRDQMRNHLKKHTELTAEELDKYIKMLPGMNLVH